MANQFTVKNGFRAEWLKIKGLGLLYLAFVIGLLMPLLLFIIKLFREDARSYDGLLIKISTYDLEESLSVFSTLFMLIFIIICASRIAQIDHKNNGWTFLESQPVSKFNIYLSKFLVLSLLTFILLLVFFCATAVFSQLIQLLHPENGYLYGLDFYWQFQSFIRLLVVSLGIISLQLMLSVIISGFVWPFVIGFLGFVINIVGTVRRETYDYIPYNNVKTSMAFTDSFELNHFLNYSEYLSLLWAFLFFTLGYLWYSKRDFKSAFIKNKKTVLTSLLLLLGFAGLYFLIVRPVYPVKSAEFSVVEGYIQSPRPIKEVLIMSKALDEEVARIPVADGHFKWKSKADFVLAEYFLVYGGRSYPFIFSKGDVVEFNIRMDEKQDEVYTKGTRKAEDIYLKSAADFSTEFKYVVEQKQHTEDPKLFYTEAQQEWESGVHDLNRFRTKENIYLGADFLQYQKQVQASRMLSAIYDYQRMTSFSDPKFAPDKKWMAELQSSIKNPAPLLLSSELYKNLQLKELLPKEGTKNPDSILFLRLSQMPPGLKKDQLLSTQLLKAVRLENREEQRNALFNTHLPQIQDQKFRNYLVKEVQLINNQQKGKVFPDLKFQDLAGNAVSLEKFKGKYVVIDFWATWCGPCRITSPVFEFQARKFKYNDNIVFLSASIDQDINKWKLDLKNSKSNTTQWWVSDQNTLKSLGVNSIPRFMMVDPDGKMYNASMPSPNETNFETLLDALDTKNFSITF